MSLEITNQTTVGQVLDELTVKRACTAYMRAAHTTTNPVELFDVTGFKVRAGSEVQALFTQFIREALNVKPEA